MECCEACKARPSSNSNKYPLSLVTFVLAIWSVFGRNLVGNYRPFGDHLPTNDIKKFWSVFGRNLVDKLIFKYFFLLF